MCGEIEYSVRYNSNGSRVNNSEVFVRSNDSTIQVNSYANQDPKVIFAYVLG